MRWVIVAHRTPDGSSCIRCYGCCHCSVLRHPVPLYPFLASLPLIHLGYSAHERVMTSRSGLCLQLSFGFEAGILPHGCLPLVIFLCIRSEIITFRRTKACVELMPPLNTDCHPASKQVPSRFIPELLGSSGFDSSLNP